MGWTCITPHGIVDTLGEMVVFCYEGIGYGLLGSGTCL